MSLSGFAGALGSAVTASEPRSIEARSESEVAPSPDAEPFSSTLARASAEHDGERRGAAEEIRSERPIKGGGISKDTRRSKQQLPEPPAPPPAAVRIEPASPAPVEGQSALTPLYSARLRSSANKSSAAEPAPLPSEPSAEAATPAPELASAPQVDAPSSPAPAAEPVEAPPPSAAPAPTSPEPTPSQLETAAPAPEEPKKAPARGAPEHDLIQAAVTVIAAPPSTTSAQESAVVAPAPTPLAAAELELEPNAELPRGRIGLIGTAITLGEGEQQITVAIRTDGHKVYLAASARSDDLLRILAQHRGELRQFLGQHGLVLESFSATARRHESSNGAEEPREGGGASEMATEDEGPPERRGRARVRVVL